MTILSDKEIKEHIGRGELILNGDVSQAQQCAYHCRTGKIFKTGPEGEIIDWDSVRRELMGRYVEILQVTKNPMYNSFIEKRLISLIPSIPDEDVQEGEKISDLFMELQATRILAETMQNKAGIAQFSQVVQQAGQPKGSPEGPSAPGQTPQEGGGLSVEGASLQPGQTLPVDVNNINQLR